MKKAGTKIKRRRAGVIGTIVVYTYLILLCATCVFPFLWMVLSSVKTPAEVQNALTITFFSKDPQWHNYVDVVQKRNLLVGLRNTLVVEAATIIPCVFFSGMSAFAFSKMYMRHRNLHLIIQLSALMIPAACVILPLYRIYYSAGLVNTLWPLILPSLFGGVSMMFFFVQFQRGIPSVIFEAAKVDGAGYLRQYTTIMFPMMKPAVAAQVIFMFIGNWNDYFLPSLFLNRDNVMTLQVMLKMLSTGSKGDLPIAFAGSVLACIPLYIIYIVFQRYFVEGMAISAVKG